MFPIINCLLVECIHNEVRICSCNFLMIDENGCHSFEGGKDVIECLECVDANIYCRIHQKREWAKYNLSWLNGIEEKEITDEDIITFLEIHGIIKEGGKI